MGSFELNCFLFLLLTYHTNTFSTPPKSSPNLDSPGFKSMFPPDRPHRRTIDDLFDDQEAMAEFEEVRRTAAALPGGPMHLGTLCLAYT
jgi:hypothetical protein